tara:strand:+ start:17921 stop:18334 length:414 start_codon:yes stop_codon:yes gene_type:complete
MSNAKIVSVDPTRFKLNEQNDSDFHLVGFKCIKCGIYIFGPATNCQQCTERQVVPIEFSGKARLYSFTVINVPPAGWTGNTPYILAEGELLEGPHVLAEIVGMESNELAINMPIEISYAIDESGKHPMAVYKWKVTN